MSNLSHLCHVAIGRGAGQRFDDFNHRFMIPGHKCAVGSWSRGERRMESNQRFYLRRAAEERTAAHRAMTEQARLWHAKLAQDFAQRAAMSSAPLAATA